MKPSSSSSFISSRQGPSKLSLGKRKRARRHAQRSGQPLPVLIASSSSSSSASCSSASASCSSDTDMSHRQTESRTKCLAADLVEKALENEGHKGGGNGRQRGGGPLLEIAAERNKGESDQPPEVGPSSVLKNNVDNDAKRWRSPSLRKKGRKTAATTGEDDNVEFIGFETLTSRVQASEMRVPIPAFTPIFDESKIAEDGKECVKGLDDARPGEVATACGNKAPVSSRRDEVDNQDYANVCNVEGNEYGRFGSGSCRATIANTKVRKHDIELASLATEGMGCGAVDKTASEKTRKSHTVAGNEGGTGNVAVLEELHGDDKDEICSSVLRLNPKDDAMTVSGAVDSSKFDIIGKGNGDDDDELPSPAFKTKTVANMPDGRKGSQSRNKSGTTNETVVNKVPGNDGRASPSPAFEKKVVASMIVGGECVQKTKSSSREYDTMVNKMPRNYGQSVDFASREDFPGERVTPVSDLLGSAASEGQIRHDGRIDRNAKKKQHPTKMSSEVIEIHDDGNYDEQLDEDISKRKLVNRLDKELVGRYHERDLPGTKWTASAAEKEPTIRRPPRRKPARLCSFHPTSSTDQDEFDVTRAKALADAEKKLEQDHADFLNKFDVSGKRMRRRNAGGGVSDRNYTAPSPGGSCALCITCSCRGRSSKHRVGAFLVGREEESVLDCATIGCGLAKSDAEVERALLARLTRLEKSVAWFEHLKYRIGRELRKHRSAIVKREEMTVRSVREMSDGVEKPSRFLPDAEEVEGIDQFIRGVPPLSQDHVRSAQRALFPSHHSLRTCQLTLTQICPKEFHTKDAFPEQLSKISTSPGDKNQDLSVFKPEAPDMAMNGKDTGNEEELYTEDNLVSRSVDNNKDALPSVVACVASSSDLAESSPRAKNKHSQTTSNLDHTSLLNPYSKSASSRLSRPNDDLVFQDLRGASLVECPGPDLWTAATTDSAEMLTKKCRDERFGVPFCARNCPADPGGDSRAINQSDGMVAVAQLEEESEENSDEKKEEMEKELEEEKEKKEEGDCIDQLLDMFSNPAQANQILSPSDVDVRQEESALDCDETEPLQSQLTQRGEEVVLDIERAVTSDPKRLLAIKAACPNWRENLRYAQRRTDEDGIRDALEKVRLTLGKLAKTREEFEKSWYQQQVVLQVYQMSLEKALQRVEQLSERGERNGNVDLHAVPGSASDVEVIEIEAESENEYSGSESSASSHPKLGGEDTLHVLSPTSPLKSAKQTASPISSAGKDVLTHVDGQKGPNSAAKAPADVVGEQMGCQINVGAMSCRTKGVPQTTGTMERVSNYSAMNTEELKKLLYRYGFKPASRQRMIDLLNRIRNQTEANPLSAHPPQQPQRSDRLCKFSTSECSDASVAFSSSLDPDFREHCVAVLKADKSLRLLMLQHRTVELSQVRGVLERAGLKVPKRKLMSFLDEQGIAFADPWKQRKAIHNAD